MKKNPRVGSNAYYANHQEVWRIRGRAAQHECAHCSGRADHWATAHGVDASDVYNHYIPLCVQCHWTYDSVERRARMSESAKGKVISPETRAKMSAAARGRAQSAEERRKKSEAIARYWAEQRKHSKPKVPRDVSAEVPLTDCLTPAEAGVLLGVDTRTLWRWANTGDISFVRTRRGYRRYPKAEISRLMTGRSALDARKVGSA